MSLIDNRIIREDLENIYKRDNINWGKFNNKTVLITGSYGMLASYLVLMFAYIKETKKINVNLINVVRSKTKFESKFGADFLERFNFELIESDLSSVIQITTNSDYIIHAASLANPNYYSTNPVEIFQITTTRQKFAHEILITKIIIIIIFLQLKIYKS